MATKRGRGDLNSNPAEVISLIDDTESENSTTNQATTQPQKAKRRKIGSKKQTTQSQPSRQECNSLRDAHTNLSQKRNDVVAQNNSVAQNLTKWKELPVHVPLAKQFTVLADVQFALPEIQQPLSFNDISVVDHFVGHVAAKNPNEKQQLRLHTGEQRYDVIVELFTRYLRLYYGHMPEADFRRKMEEAARVRLDGTMTKALKTLRKQHRRPLKLQQKKEKAAANGTHLPDQVSIDNSAGVHQSSTVLSTSVENINKNLVREDKSKSAVEAVSRSSIPRAKCVTTTVARPVREAHMVKDTVGITTWSPVQARLPHQIPESIEQIVVAVGKVALPQEYFPGMVDPTCLCCTRPGHMVQDCPALHCLSCGAVGDHFLAACPLLQECGKCHELGHSEDMCPEKLRAPSDKSAICSICHSLEHDDGKCHQIWRSYTEVIIKVKNIPVFCYVCASPTHYGPECGIRRNKILRTGGKTWSTINRNKYVDQSSNVLAIRDRMLGPNGSPSFQPPLPAESPPPPPTAGALDFYNRSAVSESVNLAGGKHTRLDDQAQTHGRSAMPMRSNVPALVEPPPIIALQAGYTTQFESHCHDHAMLPVNEDAYYRGIEHFHGDKHEQQSRTGTDPGASSFVPGSRPSTTRTSRRIMLPEARGGKKLRGGGPGGIGPSTSVRTKRGSTRSRATVCGRGGKK